MEISHKLDCKFEIPQNNYRKLKGKLNKKSPIFDLNFDRFFSPDYLTTEKLKSLPYYLQ